MQIILHIGQQKTGSTFIQSCLEQNREALAARKVGSVSKPRFPKPGRAASITMDAAFSSAHESVVVSNENFYSDQLSHRALFNPSAFLAADGRELPRLLKRYLEPFATSWRVLCYLRRPDEHLPSNYQQKVKNGYLGTLDELWQDRLKDDYYCYASRIAQWAEVFGERAIEVRIFERRTLQGNPFEDFAQWVGLNPMGLSFEAQGANESLDRLNTEILRFINRCIVEGSVPLESYNRKLVRQRLYTLNTGERLRLTRDQALRLHEQFRADHERLAERYLPPEHANVLLAPPTERSPQLPLDRQALFSRMMDLFGNPELAGIAAEKAEQSVAWRWIAERKGPKDQSA